MLGQQTVGLGDYLEAEWCSVLTAGTCLVISVDVINVGPVIVFEQRFLFIAIMSGQSFVGLKVSS